MKPHGERTQFNKSRPNISARTLARIKQCAREFQNDKQGQVALLFGLVAIPMFVAGGMAVDMARHGFHKQRLASAVDAAALAIARMDGASESEMLEVARSYIDMNYTPRADLNGNEITLSLQTNGKTVTLSANVDVPTTITTLTGVYDMHASVVSEVTKEILGTEVALVLDNTGSMSGTKISGLKTAANTLLDILFEDVSSVNKVKVAIVPFSAAVNVGSDKKNSGWIDKWGYSDITHINFSSTNWHSMKAWNKLTNRSWNGCVEARAMPDDILDTVPTSADPDTLFPPYLAPDNPDTNDSGVTDSYWNHYIDDNLPSNETDMDKRQRKSNKYKDVSVSSSSKGPGWNCDINPITPLTNVENDLRDAIDDMNANGSTNIAQGVAWGWRVLSPSEPFTEGADYANKAWKKFVIVMTDGDNDWGDLNNHNGSFYTGYGYVAQGRLDVTDPSDGDDAMNDRTRDACTNVKNATGDASSAITVYTITFGTMSTTTRQLMEDCATDTEKYYHAPTNSALEDVFELIAGDIGSLRLSK